MSEFCDTVNCTASLKCRKLVWFLVLISWVVPSCILCHMKVYESAHKAILAAYTDTHLHSVQIMSHELVDSRSYLGRVAQQAVLGHRVLMK